MGNTSYTEKPVSLEEMVTEDEQIVLPETSEVLNEDQCCGCDCEEKAPEAPAEQRATADANGTRL